MLQPFRCRPPTRIQCGLDVEHPFICTPKDNPATCRHQHIGGRMPIDALQSTHAGQTVREVRVSREFLQHAVVSSENELVTGHDQGHEGMGIGMSGVGFGHPDAAGHAVMTVRDVHGIHTVECSGQGIAVCAMCPPERMPHTIGRGEVVIVRPANHSGHSVRYLRNGLMGEQGRLRIEPHISQVRRKERLPVGKGGFVHLDMPGRRGRRRHKAHHARGCSQWSGLPQDVISRLFVQRKPTPVEEGLISLPYGPHAGSPGVPLRVDHMEIAEGVAGQLVLELVVAVGQVTPRGHKVRLVGRGQHAREGLEQWGWLHCH